MNTIGFIVASVVLVLVLMAKIPGLEHMVRPVIDMLFSGLKVVLESGFGWLVYLTKALWFSHWELLQHLVLPPESLDPTYALREQSDKPAVPEGH